jgi:hypothetical protein
MPFVCLQQKQQQHATVAVQLSSTATASAGNTLGTKG